MVPQFQIGDVVEIKFKNTKHFMEKAVVLSRVKATSAFTTYFVVAYVNGQTGVYAQEYLRLIDGMDR